MNLVLITILKIQLIKFVLSGWVLDYNFYRYKQEIVLKFYLNLLTVFVNLKLTEYQGIEKHC